MLRGWRVSRCSAAATPDSRHRRPAQDIGQSIDRRNRQAPHRESVERIEGLRPRRCAVYGLGGGNSLMFGRSIAPLIEIGSGAAAPRKGGCGAADAVPVDDALLVAQVKFVVAVGRRPRQLLAVRGELPEVPEPAAGGARFGHRLRGRPAPRPASALHPLASGRGPRHPAREVLTDFLARIASSL